MSKKIEVRVLKPISYGGRVERGEIIEMDEATMQNIGSEYVVPASQEVEAEVEDSDDELDLDSLSQAELKKLAESKGLNVSGTKAELKERIELAGQASEEDEESEEESEEE